MVRYEREIEDIIARTWPGEPGPPKHIVLVVAFHPALSDMVSHALTLAEYDPVMVITQEEALHWLQKALDEGRYPAVILLDLATPGIDGAVFLHHLRRQWHIVHPFPAIVVIPTPDVNVGSWNRIMCTPFHLEDLHSSIRDALSPRSRS